MSARDAAAPRAATAADTLSALRQKYGCGPVELTGTADGLCERHLLFDNAADPATAGPRERYEALARSVRDVLSQRWVRTEQTYERANLKPCAKEVSGVGHPAARHVAALAVRDRRKEAWGDCVTTVFPRQGQYARDAKSYRLADLTIERVGDLLTHDWSEFLSPEVTR